MAQHRAQRDDPRSAGDEEQRVAVCRVPDEVAADRAAQLERISAAQLLRQIGGDLAVVQPLDRDRDRLARRRGDRVRALCPVAVLRGQPHIEVLSRCVAWPVGDIEHERAHASGLLDEVGDFGDLPGQSPAYRCSRHGSPYE